MCRPAPHRLDIATALVVALCLVIGYARAADLALGTGVTIPRAAQQYRGTLVRESRVVWGLEAPVATFAAQIHQESAWRANARSIYAHGLTQFTPNTAEWMGRLDPALAGADTGNPVWAIRAMVRYDRWLWDRIPAKAAADADGCKRAALVLRGYNGGLGYVQKEVATRKPCEAFRSAASCRENLDYPQRILNRLEPAYEAAGWGPGVCP